MEVSKKSITPEVKIDGYSMKTPATYENKFLEIKGTYVDPMASLSI